MSPLTNGKLGWMQLSKRILIVEDEPLIAEMLREWIAELGYETVGPAASNEAALALIAGGPPLRCAILDITVRDGPSYPIAKALKERRIQYAFATGHGTETIDPQFKNAPTLLKPFDFDVLAEVIAHLVQAPGETSDWASDVVPDSHGR